MLKGKYSKIMLATFVVVILGMNYFGCMRSDNSSGALWSNSSESPLKNNSSVKKAIEVQDAFRQIHNLYKDSVVFISTEQKIRLPEYYSFFGMPAYKKQSGLGTGFVISSDGFVCTNFHVIAPHGVIVDKITVNVGKESFEAEVRGYDEKLDIALIKIESDKKLKPAYLGDSEALQVGDWTIAIGNPFGLENSFTVGVVSAINRTKEGYIQTDAAINPGNSGGPLINIMGEVIGVNRMIISKSGGYMGIGLAIPINNVKKILEDLKKQKHVEKGYIGISLIPLTVELAKQSNWKQNYGVMVRSIERNGPADVAGLLPGDIIYEVNNKKIMSIEVLVEEVEKSGPASRLSIKVWRKGRKGQFTLVTAKKPAIFK